MTSIAGIKGIRGATTVAEDSIPAITDAVVAMMTDLIEANQLQADAVITLFVTVTDDIHAVSPARIIREHFGWDKVPILCAKEPDIKGLPTLCVRVLVQFNTDKPSVAIKHIYQGQATVLRPDR